MRPTVLAIAILFAAQTAGAGENPRFSATCTDVATHAYRAGTDIWGKSMQETWSTNNERFYATWKFEYDGKGHIFINGKEGRVLAQHPGVLIVSEVPRSNGVGAGVWTYAIQLGMKKVVASQVNANGGFEPQSRGVKARSTNFDCQFDIN